MTADPWADLDAPKSAPQPDDPDTRTNNSKPA